MMPTKSRLTIAAAALALALAAPFAPLPARAQTAAPPAAAAATASATPYTRALKGEDGAVSGVQTAIRTFAPSAPGGAGPTIHLVAVTHIGEADYYKEIQQFLDRQSVVLYEGVKMGGGTATPKPAADAAPAPKPSAPPPTAAAGSPIALQQRLSRALGVRFQLEAIDYKRPHFRNSDLSWQEMERLAGQSGEATTQQLSQMRTMLGGGVGANGGAPGGTAALVASLMGQVEKSPAVAQMFRRLLVTTLADPDALAKLQASAAAASPTPPEKTDAATPLHRPGELNRILIAERNKAVVRDLTAALPGLDRGASVALFYGAAHMADLEARLVKELGYRETTDAPARWLTALLAAPPQPAATAAPVP